ncbi:MAG: hypothetical protein JRH20_29310 [Deltaproteobacteria bacterium]|nr:hypothetical protein [Deltaproteobacteria bacterium]
MGVWKTRARVLIIAPLLIAQQGCTRAGFDAGNGVERDLDSTADVLMNDQTELTDTQQEAHHGDTAQLTQAPDFAVLSMSGPDITSVGSEDSYGATFINLGSIYAVGTYLCSYIHPPGANGSASGGMNIGPGETRGVLVFRVDSNTEPGLWVLRCCVEVEGDTNVDNDCRERNITVNE